MTSERPKEILTPVDFSDSTVLGTTTIPVVRHAHCPVFTVYGGSRA